MRRSLVPLLFVSPCRRTRRWRRSRSMRALPTGRIWRGSSAAVYDLSPT